MKPIRTIAIFTTLLLCGCVTTAPPPKVSVREPTTVRPVDSYRGAPVANASASAGAIFHSPSFRGLFEDRRARMVGDVVTIQIQENMSAKRSTNSSVDRTASMNGKIGLIPFMSPGSVGRLGAEADSANSFKGDGATGSDNQFTGTITVTVVEVLANGNLSVSGEKQVGINQNVESLRFSGVINPAFLLPGNVVSSTQVADARLEVRGNGDIAHAQSMGWLQKFFMSFLPM